MKVFVTGVAGFIGSRLAARLDDAWGVDVADGDIAQPGSWRDAARGADVVIHTAAIVNNTAPIAEAWAVNVLGTRRALDAAVAAGAQRFVHFSSVRAFSDVDFPDGVDETYPVRPDGHRYVDTKVASEQVALQAHAAGEIEITVIRPGDVYGPGSKPWTLWPIFGIPAGTFGVPSEGGIFSPVYVDNLIDGVLAAAAAPSAAGQVITITDGVGVENEAFFGHYARMLGAELPVMAAEDLRRVLDGAGIGADTVDYFLRTGTYSIEKARRMIDYAPAVDVAEGMARTERWLHDAGFINDTGE